MLKLLKRWPLPHMIMFGLISLRNLFVTAGGYLLALALDEFQKNSQATYTYIGGFILLELLGVILLYWNNCIEEKTKSKIRLHIRNQIAENVAGKTTREYKAAQEEQYVNEQISSVPDFSEGYLDNVYNVISAVEIVIFGTYFFARLYSVLAIGLIAAIFLAAIVSKSFEKKAEALSKQMVSANENHLIRVSDVFEGLTDILLYGVEDYFKKKAKFFSIEYENEKWKYRKKNQDLSTLMYLPMFAIDMLLLLLVIVGILTEQTGIGTLAAFISMEGLILNNGEAFFDYVLRMKSGISMLPDYVELGKKEEVEEETAWEAVEQNPIGVQIENIEFSYGKRKIYELGCVGFEAGKKYVLEGPSGSGKSTLFRLMIKELCPQHGDIYFYRRMHEYINIDELIESELFKYVGYLPQDGHLFKDTVHYNIFFDNEVSEDKQRRILEASCLDKVLEARADGLNTVIGQANGVFSGGEQQRIRIARLLAQEKGLYLLDEPFCGIDEECAKKIEQYLLEHTKSTFVMISHENYVQNNSKWEIISINEAINPGKL